MSPSSLIAVRKRMKLSQTLFAKLVGIGRRTLIRYETGQSPIPKTVALACAALAFGLPPME
jgi:transcriptional regulator with XRE-family HTH domain